MVVWKITSGQLRWGAYREWIFVKCPQVILWSCVVLGSYASKEAKHHGLSCCVISIYNRVEAVRQFRQIRKDKSTNDRIPWHPSKHCRSSGRKGLQHAYTTVYVVILLKKKEGRARVRMKPTRYIANWQCFYFYGCFEYPVFLPYCSVCCWRCTLSKYHTFRINFHFFHFIMITQASRTKGK